MSKEKEALKGINKRIDEINSTLKEIVKSAKAENRAITEEEKKQVEEISREKDLLMMQRAITKGTAESIKEPKSEVVDFVRNAVRNRTEATLILRSDSEDDASSDTPVDMTHTTEGLGLLQPLTVGQIVKKVEEKLIWTHIGVQMPTELAGEYEWPVVGDVEATFAGEGVEIEPVKIDISKVSAVQQRVAITMALTRESIFNSRGRIESLVKEAEPYAIAKAINKVVLSPTKVKGQSLQGPFVTATAKTVDFNFKGLNVAKSALLAKGYDNDSLVWVMSEATKAELEATPKDTGSGIMTIENDKLCGRPVFTCSALDEKIGLGDFRYQVVGQFGQPSLVVDYFSKAKAGKVEITLNANFGTATLDKNAFMLLTRKTS